MNNTDTTPPAQNEFDVIAKCLGRVVMAWNMAEDRVIELLCAIARGSMQSFDVRADILIAEMGSRQVSEALRAMAYDVLEGEAADRVKHVAEMHDRLLAYRNYYVHGISVVFPDQGHGSLTPTGFIQGKSAKGKLVLHSESITLDRLIEFQQRAFDLINFASGVLFTLYFEPGETPEALPEKPALPPTLVKPRREWRDMTRPHQSSRV